MSSAPLTLDRAGRTLRNAFLSEGYRLFGPKFARDYLRLAWSTARHWGATNAGTVELLDFRLEYFNRSDVVFLVHEVFVNATYGFVSISPNPRVIDCGANIGMATLFFKALHPSSTVIAVEPEPITFEKLSRNVSRNRLRDVTLINAAVAEQPGTIALSRQSSAPGSLVATTVGPPSGDVCEVPAIKLSSLLAEPVDFLKLDVEGAEYGVIRELLTSGRMGQIRQMVVEYHQVDPPASEAEGAVEALRGAGMRVEHLKWDPVARTGLFRASAISLAEPHRA